MYLAWIKPYRKRADVSIDSRTSSSNSASSNLSATNPCLESLLTQGVGDKIKRSRVFLNDLSIESSKIETIQDIVLIYLGEILLTCQLALERILMPYIAFGIEKP
jgi:hypothetical protein